jgi:hypothetical protein
MRILLAFTFIATASLIACSDKREQAGTPCAVPADCYPMVADRTTIAGQVTCLTKYPGGYCTHTCTADTECCAVPGECTTGFKQVCSPFENQPQMYCFLSCEDADIQAAPNGGIIDPNAYCDRFAGPGLTCRSTGGGTGNRKFCG